MAAALVESAVIPSITFAWSCRPSPSEGPSSSGCSCPFPFAGGGGAGGPVAVRGGWSPKPMSTT